VLADGQVDRPRGPRRQRDGHDLAALAGHYQGPVAALDSECLGVRAGGLGYPQPVQCQQRDQRVLGRRAESGRDEQRAELVSVQANGVGFIVQPGPPHMGCGRVVEKFFLDGVAVEPCDCAQPPGDGGAGAARASRSRAKHSMSARRAANSRS
jgi:hypothetical protein